MYHFLAENDPGMGYEKFVEPVWSGTYAYRCTVDLPIFKELYPDHQALVQPKIWCGRNKHIVSLPFGPIINLICFCMVESGEGTPYDGPWVTNVPCEEVTNVFKGWEPDLIHLLEYITMPSRWAVHVVSPLPSFVSVNVALLGDTAHAMTTHQGVGGGQAIAHYTTQPSNGILIILQDAHILGHLLAHPSATISDIPGILRICEEIRKPVATAAADRSRENGLMYDFLHPDFPVAEGAKAEALESLGNAVGASFAWLAQGGCTKDLARAQMLFEERLLPSSQRK